MSSESSDDDGVAFEQQRTNEALARLGLVEEAIGEHGLVFPMPTDAVIASIVSSYDSKATGRQVRCSVCPQHQKHFKGFRVALVDGRHARIGIDCGEKQFGKDAWGSVRADYNRRVELATFQARVEPTLKVIRQVEPIIREWHNRTNKLAKWLGRLNREARELAGALQFVARRRGGRLEVERLVRREGVNANGQRHVFREAEVRVLGQIPFPPMFLGVTPTHGLNGAERELSDASAILSSKTDAASLARAFRSMQRARQHLQDADQAHAGALLNLETDWVGPLCSWACRADGLRAEYRLEARSIVHTENGDEEALELLSKVELGDSSLQAILAVWEA